ncbi:phosphoribosyltransferase [Arcobacter sp. F2176]|uniref:phosphoribosyltransferase n=1 Tax=unclassified Arcobacter TaxID=2593671 RepID=UPI00100AED47|nr:phosphoribosyltransferase family protein [Arcobacter sp. F2176]RXJ82711.1 ABC transporter [Arcobacter sp. F2176]
MDDFEVRCSGSKIYFKNREDAANKLIEILPIEKMRLEDWTVVASSFGGFSIAKIIAKKLDAQFKILFTEKVLAPNNEECEIAIVTESEEVVIHEELARSFDLSLDFIYSKSKYIYESMILNKLSKFRSGERIKDIKDKNILLVDEGLNTGLTMMACIKTAINLGAKSVSVAIPILPNASIQTIESIADDLYYVESLDHFISINYYYNELEEVTFEDIKNIKDK